MTRRDASRRLPHCSRSRSSRDRAGARSCPPFVALADQILIYGDVQGRAPVTAPAGTFDAIQIYRVVQLDDASFWRSRTIRRDRVWYAPEVKAPVREMREAQYFEHGDIDATAVYTERTITELVSFRPGRA